MARHRLATLAEVPEGGNKAFDADGRSVLLCRSAAGVFAVENRCSHQLAGLEGGRVKAAFLFCPLHGVRFDMRTGAPSGNMTKKPIAVYPVRVEGEDIIVELPD